MCKVAYKWGTGVHDGAKMLCKIIVPGAVVAVRDAKCEKEGARIEAGTMFWGPKCASGPRNFTRV